MPKVNVYLPDDLYEEVKNADLPLSRICQEALRRELRGDGARQWVITVTYERRMT